MRRDQVQHAGAGASCFSLVIPPAFLADFIGDEETTHIRPSLLVGVTLTMSRTIG